MYQKPTVCSRCGLEALPQRKLNLAAEIVAVVKSRTDLTYAEIGLAFGCHEKTVMNFVQRAGFRRGKGHHLKGPRIGTKKKLPIS